jgi:hypothetical protein
MQRHAPEMRRGYPPPAILKHGRVSLKLCVVMTKMPVVMNSLTPVLIAYQVSVSVAGIRILVSVDARRILIAIIAIIVTWTQVGVNLDVERMAEAAQKGEYVI